MPDLVMSHHSRLSRRRANALSGVGIGSWGGAAKATNAISLKVESATMDVSFVTGYLDLSRSALLDWIFGRGPCGYGLLRPFPGLTSHD